MIPWSEHSLPNSEIKQESDMKTNAGLWIDHRKAVVVMITAEGEETLELRSNIEKHPGRALNGQSSAPFEPLQRKADDSLQREFTGHLDIYYDKVIRAICDAESILIFGPGEAKGELRKRLEHAKFAGRILEVVTADEMTDPQITAKVCKHFRD